MKLKKEVINQIKELARERPTGWGTQIENIIYSLSKDERAELIALVDLGRIGGATVKDWDDMVQKAKQAADDEGTAGRLTGKGPLADYIDEAMKKMESKKS